MPVRQKLSLCFVLLIVLSVLSTNALAGCPRRVQGPPCVEYERADAVFIGVATSVVGIPADKPVNNGPYLRTIVHFTIEEAFKGVEESELVLKLNPCSYLFKEGERYLVYAHRDTFYPKLNVHEGRTRTRPLHEAAEDLQYIRGLASAEDGSRVLGKVTHHSFNLRRSDFDVEPLKNIKVILEGNGQRQEVLSDAEGQYEFKRVPTGTYQVQAELPAHLSLNKQTIKVNGRGCVPVDFGAMSKGQITGSVLDVNGNPLPSVAVSLVPANITVEEMFAENKDKKVWPTGLTNGVGRFLFKHMPPGRYLLIINRTDSERSFGRETSRHLPRLFYPGVKDVTEATVVVVGKDEDAQEYNFRLPF